MRSGSLAPALRGSEFNGRGECEKFCTAGRKAHWKEIVALVKSLRLGPFGLVDRRRQWFFFGGVGRVVASFRSQDWV